jgi:hypothetical protein
LLMTLYIFAPISCQETGNISIGELTFSPFGDNSMELHSTLFEAIAYLIEYLMH